MKRDKARIKPFCDQLAQLWETHGPDLRFGQIISCLPLSIDRPGHDPFFVEEDEMLEALQRTFSQEGKAARTLDAEQLDSLKDRWEDMMFNLYGTKFQTEEFKSLFLDTWSYLRDAVDCYGVPHKVVSLVAYLGKFNGNNQYPAHTPPWEVDVCGKFVVPCCMGWKILCVPTPAWIFTGAAWYWSPIFTSSSTSRRRLLKKYLPSLLRNTGKTTMRAVTTIMSKKNSPSLMRKRSESARWECPLPGPFEPCGLFLQRRGFPRR